MPEAVQGESLMNWLRRLFAPRQMERELNAELEDHVERLVSDYIRQGMPAVDARRQARLAFGSPEHITEACRDVRGTRWLADAVQDVRYAVRAMRVHGGFTASMVTTFALGVAVMTTLFSVFDAVVLRAFPFPGAERLAFVWTADASTSTGPVSLPDLQDWRRLEREFETIAEFRNRPAFVTTGADDVIIELHETGAGFLPLLGVAPLLGRTWTARDMDAGQTQVAVISHALWQQVFGGDANVLGRTLTASHVSYQVIGVMPAGFRSPSTIDLSRIGLSPARSLWVPFVARPVHAFRGNRGLRVIARVAASTNAPAAQVALSTLSGQLSAAYPDSNRGKHARLVSLAETIAGTSRQPLLALLFAAVLVMLTACSNAAGLLVVRTRSRMRELTLRIALGASRARLMRQIVTESALMSLIGGTLGLASAALLLSALRRLPVAGDVPRLAESVLDARSWGVAIAVIVSMVVVVGVTPAAKLLTIVSGNSHGPSGERATTGPGETRIRQALIAVQIAVALMLTVSAALLTASVWQLTQPKGLLEPNRTLTLQTTTAGTRWNRAPADRLLYEELNTRLRSIPGVEDVGFTTQLLQAGDSSSSDVVVEGSAPLPPDQRPLSAYTLANAGLLGMSGLRLEEGRFFDRDDRAGGARVAVVNNAFVRAVRIDGGVIGRQVRLSGLGAGPFEIVGVVEDSRAFDVGTPDGPRLYYHYAQIPAGRFVVLIRFRQGADIATSAVRQIVRDIDPQLPALEVQTVADLVDQATARPRWGSTIVAAFGVMTLALACVGVYGVVAYAAARRTRECGIRMALGATRAAICRVIAQQSLAPLGCGLAIGTLGAIAAERVLLRLGFLPGLDDRRWLIVALAEATLGLAAGVAALLPAVRAAAQIHPSQVLRQE